MFEPHICCERQENQKRYMVETHDDIPLAVPKESGVDLVRPVRWASDKDVLLDVHAVYLCEDLVESTVVCCTGVAQGATTHFRFDQTAVLKSVSMQFLGKTSKRGGMGGPREAVWERRGGWQSSNRLGRPTFDRVWFVGQNTLT